MLNLKPLKVCHQFYDPPIAKKSYKVNLIHWNWCKGWYNQRLFFLQQWHPIVYQKSLLLIQNYLVLLFDLTKSLADLEPVRALFLLFQLLHFLAWQSITDWRVYRQLVLPLFRQSCVEKFLKEDYEYRLEFFCLIQF